MIKTLDELKIIVDKLKKDGKKIVFTNGVFDILHKGHVDYLNVSAEFGDLLIVGINNDDSVRRLKGPERPVNKEGDRAYIIKNLKCVYETFIFTEDTPLNSIKELVPDILVKGGDYDENETNPASNKYIVGSDIVKNAGGSVRTVSLTEGRSTTGIIERVRK